MSKKQEELTVREMMGASGILERIEQFSLMMNSYQAREIMQGKRYAIQHEFYELEKIIDLFENQLEDLLEQSKGWETTR